MQKTRVTEIGPGATIDFDAHTGNYAHWQDTLTAPDGTNLPYTGWQRVTGQHTVTKVERVLAPVTSGMRKRFATALAFTFENGRVVEVRGTAKWPVV